MKKLLLYLFIITSVCNINACTLQVKTNAGKIRNGIQITENGLHAEQAFLLKEDGTLISDDNKIEVGEQVLLRLIINGWQEKNGTVYPEASEKIATNTGIVFLDEPALFSSSLPNGTTLENAKTITLFATITKLEKLYDYFLVSFKVWDKSTNKSLSGSYKLYI